jgi:hypothetical protein
MPGKKENIDAAQLLTTIKRGLPAAPGQMSAQEFSLLCENIVAAIAMAIDQYDSRSKSLEPDYGEEERVV